MWQLEQEGPEWGPDRVVRTRILAAGKVLSYQDTVRAWAEQEAFRTFFLDALRSAPHRAFSLETRPVTGGDAEQPFEYVVVPSADLGLVGADAEAFADKFARVTAPHGVAVFPNLGADATLVVPCPMAARGHYGHLAAFLRGAPVTQQHALLARVAATIGPRIGSRPIWLNTAGLGVPWLHVRIDSRPKYYRFQPYRTRNA